MGNFELSADLQQNIKIYIQREQSCYDGDRSRTRAEEAASS